MGKEPSDPDSRIRRLRKRVDTIDDRIAGLLEERARRVLSIGRVKKALGLPVYSPEREREILERLARKNAGPLSDAAIRRLFERIIDESRSLERADRGGSTAGGRDGTGG